MAFEFDEKPAAGTNRHAAVTTCTTCGGDRYVTVRLRSPDQTVWMNDNNIRASKDMFHEETAPCYSCNHDAYGAIRYRGFIPIDPAQAQRLHTG